MRDIKTYINEGFFKNVGGDPHETLKKWYADMIKRGSFPGDSIIHMVTNGTYDNRSNHNSIFIASDGNIRVVPFRGFSRQEVKSKKFTFAPTDVPEVLQLDPLRTLPFIVDGNGINFIEYVENNPSIYSTPSGKNVRVFVKRGRTQIYYDYTLSNIK